MLAEFVLHDGKLRQTAFKHRYVAPGTSSVAPGTSSVAPSPPPAPARHQPTGAFYRTQSVLPARLFRLLCLASSLLQNADAEELQSVFSALFCKARSEPGTYRPHALFDYLVVQMVSNEALRADASHPGHTQIIMADHLSRIVIAFLKQAGVIS